MRRPLFLTGMMGCGKTTVGRILANDLGVPLVDLDARIERLFATRVSALLAERGEPGFREVEQLALGSLLAEPGLGGRAVVVATGGGAVLHQSSREAMDRVGTRVYLEVGVDELVRRLRLDLEADAGSRPLLQGGGPSGDSGGEFGGAEGEGPTEAWAGGPTERPGAGLRQRVAELLAARRGIYRGGALCIDGQGEPGTVAARIVEALHGGPCGGAPEASGTASGGDAPVQGSEAV